MYLEPSSSQLSSEALTLNLAQMAPSTAEEPVFTSQSLLQGHREILIRHGDRVYRLRHTSNDKLILTK